MALTVRDWASLFTALGIIGIFFILFTNISTSGRSETDVFCEYFRTQNATLYNEILSNPKYSQFKDACCAYDTGNQACG
jgi:hypothetical protein